MIDREELYISLYEDMLPSAEYLQADSKHRNLLPEATIVAALAFALCAFVEGFFQGLGAEVAAGFAERVKSFFKQSELTGSREPMLEGLELLGPLLKHLPNMSFQYRTVCINAISDALQRRGYPKDVAEETAYCLMESLNIAGENKV